MGLIGSMVDAPLSSGCRSAAAVRPVRAKQHRYGNRRVHDSRKTRNQQTKTKAKPGGWIIIEKTHQTNL